MAGINVPFEMSIKMELGSDFCLCINFACIAQTSHLFPSVFLNFAGSQVGYHVILDRFSQTASST